MSRSATVRVVNATGVAIKLSAAKLGAGRLVGQGPGGQLAPNGMATLVNLASGRFGSANGNLTCATPAGSVTINWRNPFAGVNSYRIETDGDSIGCVCDGDDDDRNTTVTFTLVPTRKVGVPGFRPSTHGFRFTNSWPDEPLKRIKLLIGTLPIGKASNGLCGGMCFAVRDYYEARRAIPTITVRPPDRSVLREYVIDRLIDSFDLPAGVAPYATLMSTRYPADDNDLLASIAHVPSRAAIFARRTWPLVKSSIDRGHPCPLGLVMLESDQLDDLSHHHQVLAYAYQLRGTRLTVWVYDPNSPSNDRVTIAFDTARTDRPLDITHNVDSAGPLVCAFVPKYVAATPP
jgi:hypothetical protein